jgi:CheY-like chemotaxis protein
MSARILVIEDDLISQDIVKSALEARGFIVDAASDGFSAIRLLNEGSYDLALVDYQLPEMDGYASARVLHGFKDAAALKLVAVTANMDALRSRPGAEELFDVILPKPLDLPSLLRAVSTSLVDPNRSFMIDEATRLWRERGMRGRPAAKVVPAPTREQAITIGVCFDIVDWAEADLVLLTDSSAALPLELLRTRSDASLLPVVDLSDRMAGVSDATFQLAQKETWSSLAETVVRFNRQRARLPQQYQHAADLDDRLLAYLFLSERPLTPTIDASSPHCVRYPGHFPSVELIAAAERLANRGLLSRRFVDRFHVCAACGSHRLNVREECPNCRSPNLTEGALLHHFKCAYQGPEGDFRSGANLVCPKCRQHLRHYGGDYDKPGTVLVCGACSSSNSNPAVGFSCLDCGMHMDGDAAARRDFFAYMLTARAIAILDSPGPEISIPRLPTEGERLPLPVTDAASDLAAQTHRTLAEFAVIEIRYKAQSLIVASEGYSAFESLRRLFVQNMVDVLADHGRVVAAIDLDYVVVRKNGDEALPTFAAGLLRHCQGSLSRSLDPLARFFDANGRTIAA